MSLKVKRYLGYAMSIFTAFSFAACLMCMTLKLGIMDISFLKESMRNQGYYAYKQEVLEDDLIALIDEYGLPERVTEGVITDRMISIDTNKDINNMLNDKNSSYNTHEMETVLRDNIINYLREEGVESTEIFSNYIDGVVKKAAVQYKSNIGFEFVDTYSVFYYKYSDIINIVFFVFLGVNVICLLFSLTFRSRKYRGLRYYNYGIVAGSFISVIATALVGLSFVNTFVGNTLYYSIIREFCIKAFVQGIYVSVVGFVYAAVVLLFLYSFNKKYI
ncbi:MAG: hypothetical protein E7267_07810 [Lachnospiraceae bacterium]|nr:hypothetical protein [Lachnospiraceae bacterium]